MLAQPEPGVGASYVREGGLPGWEKWQLVHITNIEKAFKKFISILRSTWGRYLTWYCGLVVTQESGFPSSQLSLICFCHNSKNESGVTWQMLQQRKKKVKFIFPFLSLDMSNNHKKFDILQELIRHCNTWFPLHTLSLLWFQKLLIIYPQLLPLIPFNYSSTLTSTPPWVTLISKYVFRYFGYSCYSISQNLFLLYHPSFCGKGKY